MHQLDDPSSAFSNSDLGKKLRDLGRGAFLIGERMIASHDPVAAATLRAAADASNGWDVEMQAANANYRPGVFTTFVAYEWTASPGQGIHMHRNVFFNTDHAPAPFTAVDSNNPEDLWKYLDSVRRQGIDVLAIPHNSNLSDGRDFDWNMSNGRPIDEAYAQERALNEPLAEITQTKGSSDTTPELSPEDEFANFDIMDRIYKGETSPNQHGSYVREALGRGLVIQQAVGANPFKLGVVGASDIHNGLTVSDEAGYAGGVSGLDPRTMLPTGDAARRALGMDQQGGPGVRPTGQRENDPLQFGSGGLTGVWAEANTRNAIFAALKRKETFATSGTRIRIRMFGGWDFSPAMLHQADWVAGAYAHGVPMGADLPAEPAAARAPSFVLQAMKDPDGANLDRIQIIKIWLDHGAYKEKVFDVALSGGRHRPCAGGGQHDRHDHRRHRQHHRRRRLDRRLARPRVRSEDAGRLLRPRARDPDAALDHAAGHPQPLADPDAPAAHPPGTRLDVAHMVHATEVIASFSPRGTRFRRRRRMRGLDASSC
jgi:hypothetical protein